MPSLALRGTAAWRGACTLLYCSVFVVFGLGVNIIGPALEKLTKHVHLTNEGDLAPVFFLRGACGIPAALAAGVLVERVRGHRLLSGVMLLLGVGLALVPHATSLWALAGVFGVQGAGFGMINATCNTYIQWVWGEKVGPWINLIHALFGVGCIVAPVLVSSVGSLDIPYWAVGGLSALLGLLTPLLESPEAAGGVGGPEDAVEAAAGGRAARGGRAAQGSRTARHEAAARALRTVDALGFPGFSIPSPTAPPPASDPPASAPPDAEDDLEAPLLPPAGGDPPAGRDSFTAIALGGLIICLGVGAEISYGVWIFTFAHKAAGVSVASATAINSLYWSSMTVGRVAAVPVSAVAPPEFMLGAGFAAGVGSMAALALLPASSACLWVATAGIGVGVAPLFPNTMSLVGRYTRTTGMGVAVLSTCGGLGDMILPPLVALSVKRASSGLLVMPMWVGGMLGGSGAALVVLLAAGRLGLVGLGLRV